MYRVAVDVGGTHTDGIVVTDSGAIRMAKADTTPQELSQGVINCCGKLGRLLGESLDEFLSKTELILHGTTVGTNAVLQSSEPRVGSLVTKGFRDILELRRGYRDTGYNLKVPYPQPLCPRDLRLEVSERTSHFGEVLEPLDEESCRRGVRLLRERGATSIAITFLFSFLNPGHERRAKEIVLEEWPGVHVSLSSDVLPQIEEFERFSATALDAYIGPSTAGYIKSLGQALAEHSFKGRLLIGQCNGSIVTPQIVLNRPVWTISSGPAAAGPAALYSGELFDTNNVISVDMGGTSFDVLLVLEGEAQTSTDEWVGDYRLAVPMVKVRSIGAGGGSIASLDTAGVLCVGPKSSGAVPGPACYAKGGVLPTVTDADVLLGYLSPGNFLEGERTLDVEKARVAMEDKIAKPLGLSVTEAAAGIVRVLVHNSAEAIRRECLDRGADPREFLMVAGGGAGPVHAAFIAEELEMKKVVVPSVAPAYCAFGWLRSDMVLDFVRSKVMPSRGADLEQLNAIYDEMEATAKRELGDDDLDIRRMVDARYYGQFRETEVEVPNGKLGDAELRIMEDNFHRRHERLFKFKMTAMELEFIHYRVKAVLKTEKVRVPKVASNGSSVEQARRGTRECTFGKDVAAADIYLGDKLRTGDAFDGPAIIEQGLTTVVVPPAFHCTIDAYGNFVLTHR